MAGHSALLRSFEEEMEPAARRVEEEARRATEPDPQLGDEPLQWSPELSLMLAILEDAIACYRKTLKRPRQNPEILARQAEFWLRLDDWDSPFSFNNICEALRLDPEATRQRILASRDEQAGA
ncbi:MAG: hypothetical protein D6760_10610 [Deltaproteobacteria bacterium]|nr:MAG: hypothetical protein D6760_10610 [Deltaproteobacteria bacterium]